MANHQYSFPILEADQLLKELAELNVPVPDASVLQKPTQEGVKPLFEHFLTEVAEFSRDDVWPKFCNFNLAHNFRNPEYHDESIQKHSFFKHLRSLMSQTGVKDFGWKDLWKPESLRLKRQLSALVNFNFYKLELAAEFAEAEDGIAAEMEKFAAREQESRKLQHDYEAAVSAREAEQHILAEIKAEALQLDSDIHGQESRLKSLKLQVMAKQSELAGLDQELEKVFTELQEVEKEMDYWRSQILQDPEQLHQELQRLAEENKQGDLERSKRKAQITEIVEQLAQVQELSKAVHKCGAQLEAVEEAVGRKKAANGRYKELHKILVEKSDGIEKCVAQMRALDQRIGEGRERISQFKEKAKAKIKDLDQRLESIQQQSSKRDPALKALSDQYVNVQQEMALVHHQAESVKAVHQRKLESLGNSYAQFQGTCLQHAQKMQAASQQVVAALPKDKLKKLPASSLKKDAMPLTGTPRTSAMSRTPLPR